MAKLSVFGSVGKFSQMSYRKVDDHAVKLLLSLAFARDKIQAV